MPAKSEEIRNNKQRERQQKLRDADRKAKRPGRDDVARTALFMSISSMVAKGSHDALEAFRSLVIEMLVRQGFDERKRLAEGVGLEVPGHKRLDFRDRPALSNAGQCL